VGAVKSELQQDGFTEVMCDEEFDGKTFMVDDQCSDVLSFPNELISYVEKHPLVTSGALVLQVSRRYDTIRYDTIRAVELGFKN